MPETIHADVVENFWDTGPPTKCCAKCLKNLPIESFRLNRSRNGRMRRASYCRPCETIVVRESESRIAKNGLTNKDNRLNRQRGEHSIGVDVNEGIRKQNGLCAICHKPERARHRGNGPIMRLALDHDHKTGKCRGFLCARCNWLLAYATEDPAIFDSAAAYLRKHAP